VIQKKLIARKLFVTYKAVLAGDLAMRFSNLTVSRLLLLKSRFISWQRKSRFRYRRRRLALEQMGEED
jgi:hypothetical protein